MNLSINKARLLPQLKQKKYRNESKRFVVEGKKMIDELVLSGWPVDFIVATDSWQPEKMPVGTEIYRTTDAEFRKLSSLATPNEVLAVVRFSNTQPATIDPVTNLVLMLDTVQDPGNLGTIIRLADWFGIRQVVCSPSTVDVYNPKVIQATMGSIFRVEVFYSPLLPLLENARVKLDVPSYATLLNGQNIYEAELSANGFIVLGNESKGVSSEVAAAVGKGIKIPPYPEHRQDVDSLNVSVAAAIVCSEFRRRVSG